MKQWCFNNSFITLVTTENTCFFYNKTPLMCSGCSLFLKHQLSNFQAECLNLLSVTDYSIARLNQCTKHTNQKTNQIFSYSFKVLCLNSWNLFLQRMLPLLMVKWIYLPELFVVITFNLSNIVIFKYTINFSYWRWRHGKRLGRDFNIKWYPGLHSQHFIKRR